jgi:hypothetical protein
MQSVRPAYMDEYEQLQSELQGLYQQYLDRYRGLEYLESELDQFNTAEQDALDASDRRLKKMQKRLAYAPCRLSFSHGCFCFGFGKAGCVRLSAHNSSRRTFRRNSTACRAGSLPEWRLNHTDGVAVVHIITAEADLDISMLLQLSWLFAAAGSNTGLPCT